MQAGQKDMVHQSKREGNAFARRKHVYKFTNLTEACSLSWQTHFLVLLLDVLLSLSALLLSLQRLDILKVFSRTRNSCPLLHLCCRADDVSAVILHSDKKVSRKTSLGLLDPMRRSAASLSSLMSM